MLRVHTGAASMALVTLLVACSYDQLGRPSSDAGSDRGALDGCVDGAGCEAGCGDTATDPNNCGACGHRCPGGAHVDDETCVAGACGLRCAANFADCDGLAADGCEVDLRSDAAHCGSCGRPCPTTGPEVLGSVCRDGAFVLTC